MASNCAFCVLLCVGDLAVMVGYMATLTLQICGMYDGCMSHSGMIVDGIALHGESEMV